MKKWYPVIISLVIGSLYFIVFPNFTTTLVIVISYYLSNLLLPKEEKNLHPFIHPNYKSHFKEIYDEYINTLAIAWDGSTGNVMGITIKIEELIQSQYGKNLSYEESEELIKAIKLATETLKKKTNIKTNYDNIQDVIQEIRKVSNE